MCELIDVDRSDLFVKYIIIDSTKRKQKLILYQCVRQCSSEFVVAWLSL
jgi:hypothetical protein